jgi:hypothetical protein
MTQLTDSHIEISERHTRWRLGYENFSRLDGSVVKKWYIIGSQYKEKWGGFDSEEQAIRYLLDVIRKRGGSG